MLRIRRSSFQILGELGMKVNFAVIGAGNMLAQLSEYTLRAATAADKSRNGGQTQVSESSGAEVGRSRR